MASQLARENTRYYVGRRDLNGETETVLHFVDYNRLFITEDTFARTDGFNEARTANVIAARLNNIEDEAAADLGTAKRFHYFTYKKDDQVIVLGNFDYEVPEEEAPEEVPEELPEEEAPEEAPEEPTE